MSEIHICKILNNNVYYSDDSNYICIKNVKKRRLLKIDTILNFENDILTLQLQNFNVIQIHIDLYVNILNKQKLCDDFKADMKDILLKIALRYNDTNYKNIYYVTKEQEYTILNNNVYTINKNKIKQIYTNITQYIHYSYFMYIFKSMFYKRIKKEYILENIKNDNVVLQYLLSDMFNTKYTYKKTNDVFPAFYKNLILTNYSKNYIKFEKINEGEILINLTYIKNNIKKIGEYITYIILMLKEEDVKDFKEKDIEILFNNFFY